MTLIKKAPLMAFGLGLGLMSIMLLSSFMGDSNMATRYYFYDDDGAGSNVPTWHTSAPVGGLNLSCVNQSNRICSAEFDLTPTSTTNTVEANEDADIDTIIQGTYQ